VAWLGLRSIVDTAIYTKPCRADSDIDLCRRVLIAALALMRRRLRSAQKVLGLYLKRPQAKSWL
jgi:hypothetical protein